MHYIKYRLILDLLKNNIIHIVVCILSTYVKQKKQKNEKRSDVCDDSAKLPSPYRLGRRTDRKDNETPD